MAGSIREWLDGLGLARYAETFEENELDLDLVADLRDSDLKELGVAAMGHRKKLLRAIDALAAAATPAHSPDDAAAAPREASSISPAERRQLTVMFCDLVGSTALSQRLDPEDLREVMRRYQDAVAGAVTRYGGYVAKYLGDGVLAYFGWPQAYEDQAERAVRAGLDAVAAVSGLKLEGGVELQARAGIATGQVVVGDLIGKAGRDADAVVGETPNLAARLQEVAGAGQVAVGEATRHLIGEVFQLHDLGTQNLKGFAEPLSVWLVVGGRVVESRFEAVHAGQLTAFVGREPEIDMLVDRWAQAKQGEGQVVLVSGEAGIGKSRIAQTLRERIADEPHTRLRFQCLPYYTSTALYPFISQLEQAAKFVSDDTPEAKLGKLEALLSQSTEVVAEVAPLIASLLSVPWGNRYRALEMSPQQQKELTLKALTDQLLGLAARQPVLMVFEDAHWVDPTSLQALEQIIDQIQGARVLAVITFRPEFTPSWHGYTHITSLALNRLGREQCAAIVGYVTGDKALPNQVLDQIIDKTDGVPLFVEELTKTVIESDLLQDRGYTFDLTGTLPRLAIPSTLRDSLMARLDKLALVKEVAQTGAAIGREFPYELLAAVSPLDADQLEGALARLVESELVFAREAPPQAEYTFKHALVRDAAYESLLRDTRQRLHARIAHAIEEHFPTAVETEPELLAYHYTEAGLAEQAIEYWLRAGQHAYERSAIVEAISHLNKGLEVLSQAQENSQHLHRELKLQTVLGSALKDLKSYGHPDVERAYSRASEICQLVGSSKQNFPALLGLGIYYVVRAKLRTALELGNQLLRLAGQIEDPVLLVAAHYAMGVAYFPLGEFAKAQEHLSEGAAHYDPAAHQAHVSLYGQDGGAICLCRLALALWYLGYPEQAQARSRQAMELAERLRHPFSLAYVRSWKVFLEHHLGDVEATERGANKTVAIASEQGFVYWLPFGQFFQGRVQVTRGSAEQGIATMHRALKDMQEIGTELSRPYFLGLLAEAYGTEGRAEEGLRAIEVALAAVEEHDQRWPEAELRRLKGELMLKAGGAGEKIELCFKQAFDVARRQQAKSLELRVAMSLARLWTDQGKVVAARDVLAPIYDWFTEGFDTPDLKEAKALLEELG